jgi:hypothetical protein
MHTQLGKDGIWAASGRGPMRWIVGEGATEMEAKARFRGVEFDQKVEELGFQHAMEQSLTEMSLHGDLDRRFK